ncbi:MAG: hypothetical protein Q9207_006736 [Kuettlingeria erythrocarpa]
MNRLGFTELASTEGARVQSLGSKRVNIILVHGLRGHPYKTWASSKKADNERAAGSSSWRQKFKPRLRKPTTLPSEGSNTQKDASSRQQEVFWPQDYLAEDIPEARVWTFGYNADMFGELFQANNKNSVSGHGRDLAVRLEREVENKNNNQDPIVFLAHGLGGIVVKDVRQRCSTLLNPKEDPKESVRRYLNSDAAGKWLLIVDNADDEEILFRKSSDSLSVIEYLRQSENGLTLCVTRHRLIVVSLARNEVVKVDEMDQEEAENFFLKDLLIQKEMVHDQKDTTELLKELAYWPLAIPQAAAYINEMQTSIPEYLSLLRSTEQDTASLLSR